MTCLCYDREFIDTIKLRYKLMHIVGVIEGSPRTIPLEPVPQASATTITPNNATSHSRTTRTELPTVERSESSSSSASEDQADGLSDPNWSPPRAAARLLASKTPAASGLKTRSTVSSLATQAPPMRVLPSSSSASPTIATVKANDVTTTSPSDTSAPPPAARQHKGSRTKQGMRKSTGSRPPRRGLVGGMWGCG